MACTKRILLKLFENGTELANYRFALEFCYIMLDLNILYFPFTRYFVIVNRIGWKRSMIMSHNSLVMIFVITFSYIIFYYMP